MGNPIPSAHGVVYTESHGLRMFRCEAQAATLTTTSCISNYRTAKSQIEVTMRPALDHCRYCTIGACHAGEKSRVRSSTFCPRCHRSDLRFIPSSGLCVSCYNRQAEIKRGKNARGNLPKKLLQRAPVPHSIVFMHEGKLVRFERLAVDSFEPMLAAVFMARSPETLRFTFGRPDLEPAGNGPAPNWQRNSKRERRELDRDRGEIKKQALALRRVGGEQVCLS